MQNRMRGKKPGRYHCRNGQKRITTGKSPEKEWFTLKKKVFCLLDIKIICNFALSLIVCILSNNKNNNKTK